MSIVAACCLLGVLTLGCKSKPVLRRAVGPQTLLREDDSANPQSNDQAAAAGQQTSGESLLIDAMVGQVNGQPIYASTIFEEIDDIATELGETLPPHEFRNRVAKLISGKLRALVEQSLLLGEAQRELNEQQERMLQNELKKVREQIVREFGFGSLELANETLRVRQNSSVDEELENKRQEALTRNHLWHKLGSRINITRREIEQYYKDNKETYQPPPQRVLRLMRIKATDSDDADRIDQLLADGEPFAQVARRRINKYAGQDNQGLFSEEPVQGNAPFAAALAPLNEAIVRLQTNQHSKRIDVGENFWWVFVQSVEQPLQRTVAEAQVDINNALRAQRFRQLTQEYYNELLANGSFDPIDAMAEALIDVAMTRYAKAPRPRTAAQAP